MKRTLLLVLCLLMILPPTGVQASVSNQTVQAADGFTADQVGAQVMSVALALWMNDHQTEATDPLLLWDAAGWYAALQHRTDGYDLISEQEVRAFLRSVNDTGDFMMPESWENSGVVRKLTGPDGVYYDFSQHKVMLDSMLGIDTEIRTRKTGSHTVRTEVIYHYNDTDSAAWTYEFDFVDNPDDLTPFPWMLERARSIPFEPEILGDVDFDWGDLMYALRTDTVLNFCSGVWIGSEAEGTPETWVFREGDGYAMIAFNTGMIFGSFRGLDFESDGTGGRPVVRSTTEEDSEAGWISGYLSDVIRMELDRVEGDNVVFQCDTRGGAREVLTLNRFTLWPQRIDYPENEYGVEPLFFRYDRQVPDFDFLRGWKEGLRTVTLVWEDYYTGTPRERTEFFRLPVNWEFIPRETMWGEYTVYMNQGYTELYRYPGDGLDYTLYLTTAKG